MEVQNSLPLAPFTTFHIGGPAQLYIEAFSEEEIRDALAHAHASGLPVFILGAGSNVLIPDAGVAGVVLRVMLRDITINALGKDVFLIAGAGAPWDTVVTVAGAEGLFGIENLAGIPGTMGGAAVQNIGAYGAEFSNVFAYADGIDRETGDAWRVTGTDAQFAYRSSFFKTHPEFIITRVALRLSKSAPLSLAYADLIRAREQGVVLTTPRAVAHAVRAIRAQKFPLLSKEGTAGSFFKNPIISQEHAARLIQKFPNLPVFPQDTGAMKVSLAWILDHVLALKGYEKGRVRLYEQQPLVLVARTGATAHDVTALADEISERVFSATNISIEREVEIFGERR
ncbi:MAG TPA: UDP-N-acetylmuramate dehydrogenase [Candidatus Paceibacterota bacterium]|nr:UDP-N-acetylmuramate dehydrogenase [Candidatus Paceibacterota bacterium]